MLHRAPSTTAIKIHKTIKVVIVGDGAVGKTALLIYYTTKSFPHEYVPTVFDNFSCIEMFEQKPVSIVLWDTAGQEDYDKLRPLSYPQTDVFLVCYSVASRDSFINVKNKWLKEIAPVGAPFILIATKADLRNDKKTIAELGGPEHFITPQEGAALAQELGAGAFMECSALSGSGINDIFQETIRQSIARAAALKAKPKKENSGKDDKEKEKETDKDGKNKDKDKKKDKDTKLTREKSKKDFEKDPKKDTAKREKGRSNTHPEDLSKIVASVAPPLGSSSPPLTTTTAPLPPTGAAVAAPVPVATAKPPSRWNFFSRRGKN